MNGQNQRRQGTYEDIEQEMGGMRDRILRAVQAHAEWGAASQASMASLRREAFANGNTSVFPHAFALAGLASEEDREGLKMLANDAIVQALATTNATSIHLVHELDSRLSKLAGSSLLELALEAQAPLRSTLCLLLKREYACLSGFGY